VRPKLERGIIRRLLGLTAYNFVCIVINMKSRRAYTMRARADAAAATRQKIIDAAVALLKTRLRTDIRLDDVAAAAGASVQTILRIFGSRAALMEHAGSELMRQIGEQRDRAAPGDIDGAIADLFEHYEEVGDAVIHSLADEDDPAVQPLIAIGRTQHRRWVERHFGPQLASRDPAGRERLVDALVCACDVYTWKLLRRDMGRSLDNARLTMAWAVKTLLGEA
jgi:AcrR family transcriptional regulator